MWNLVINFSLTNKYSIESGWKRDFELEMFSWSRCFASNTHYLCWKERMEIYIYDLMLERADGNDRQFSLHHFWRLLQDWTLKRGLAQAMFPMTWSEVVFNRKMLRVDWIVKRLLYRFDYNLHISFSFILEITGSYR